MSLTEIGPASRPVLGRLAVMASSAREELRFGCLEALHQIDPQDSRAQAVFLWYLLSRNDDFRLSALTGLGKVERFTDSMCRAVVCRLKDSSYQVRAEAARSLGRRRCYPDTVVPALSGLLVDEHWEVRKESLKALGLFGNKAKSAVYAVLEAFRQEEEDYFHRVRSTAAITLGRIGAWDPEVIPSLIEGLSDPEPTMRAGCARALGTIGPPAESSIPFLLDLLKSLKPGLRYEAAEALWRIAKGTERADVLKALDQAAKKETEPEILKALKRAARQVKRKDY
jgi:HEAT repeat protein